MNNVLDIHRKRPLTLDEAEDAIWRVGRTLKKASDDETEAAPDTEEETTGDWSSTRKTMTRSTLRKKPRTKKLTIKRKTR